MEVEEASWSTGDEHVLETRVSAEMNNDLALAHDGGAVPAEAAQRDAIGNGDRSAVDAVGQLNDVAWLGRIE